MSRSLIVTALALVSGSALPSAAEGPPVGREPFAKAHVLMMARAESRDTEARMADVEVWAEGTRLRALVHGARSGEFWLDGLASDALMVRDGKVVEPKRKSLEQGLLSSLRASPDLGNSKNDRVAGRPCKVVTEELKGGYSLTRCLWRGLPLSVELSGHGFSFHAAATLVEEGRVTVADLQPPPGAPSAPKGMSAGN
jgi:hypothetical protein